MSEFKVGDIVQLKTGAQIANLSGGGILMEKVDGFASSASAYRFAVVDMCNGIAIVKDEKLTGAYAAIHTMDLIGPKRTITLEDGKTVTLSAESYEALAKEAK